MVNIEPHSLISSLLPSLLSLVFASSAVFCVRNVFEMLGLGEGIKYLVVLYAKIKLLLYEKDTMNFVTNDKLLHEC